MTYDKVLAAAIVLSKHLKEETAQPRVGIILPPGRAGLIANLAVLFANKVPVNINFTAGIARWRIRSSRRNSTGSSPSIPFVRKMSRFNWPPNKQLIFLERLLPLMRPQIARWFLLAKILPTRLLASLLKIPRQGGSREAVLLFTSGSSGDPKGVILSHRNLLGNVNQFGARDRPWPQGPLAGLPAFVSQLRLHRDPVVSGHRRHDPGDLSESARHGQKSPS